MARIVTNSNAITVFKNYSRSMVSLAKSAERLASGLRINRASDDAAGLAISETFRAQIKGADMASENIENAINFINTADGYLQNINDILGRMEELAVEYTDDTKSSDDKSNIDVEFKKLSAELQSVVDARAKYNGELIFQSRGLTIQVGPDSGQTFLVATADRNLVSASGFSSVASTAGMSLNGASAGNTATLAEVQEAITGVSKFRATLGSYQSQLQFTITGLQNYSENISAAESRIRNVDVAKETTNFSRYQIQVQAGTAMLAQANSIPQVVLGLLGG